MKYFKFDSRNLVGQWGRHNAKQSGYDAKDRTYSENYSSRPNTAKSFRKTVDLGEVNHTFKWFDL